MEYSKTLSVSQEWIA